jgi:ribosomal protein L29
MSVITKASDLRDKSIDELEMILLDSTADLFTTINEIKLNKKGDLSQVKIKKRNIARIHTVIREKQLAK